MKRKIFKISWIFVAISLVFSLVACGNTKDTPDVKQNESESNDEEKSSDEGKIITLIASQDWIKDPELELAEKLAK